MRWRRPVEGVLTFAGIMLILAAVFNLLAFNIGLFAGIGCFVAVGVIEQYV